MVYLLIGQDVTAKEIQLKKIKQEFLPLPLQDFNLDTLYAKEIVLKDISLLLIFVFIFFALNTNQNVTQSRTMLYTYANQTVNATTYYN